METSPDPARRSGEESSADVRHRHLLALLDEVVRDLETPEEIVTVTTRLVGSHLGVSECHYVLIDEDAGFVRTYKGYRAVGEPRETTVNVEGFAPTMARLRAGLTTAVEDARIDPLTRDTYEAAYAPIGIRAYVGVPRIWHGKLTADFSVIHSVPRRWSPEDIRLIEATAARTWMAVEHLQALRQIRDQEARFRVLVEGMPSFVWSSRVDGTSEYVSPQWSAYTGIAPEEGGTRRMFEPIHPEDRARVQEEWRRTLGLGVPFESEFRLRSKGGEYRYFRAQANPIPDPSGVATRWIGTTTEVHEARAMRIELEEHSKRLAKAYEETFERLARAAALRDDDTADHTKRVGVLTCMIAERLGLDRHDAAELGRAAELHDLGKIAIPDAILHKPGRLTSEERSLMETHTTLGASLLDGGESPLLRRATSIALSHHERWDGGGYPQRLRGGAIPLDARIVAVADAYDAMTSDRPYRHALSIEEARARLTAGSGSQWDGDVVEAFLANP